MISIFLGAYLFIGILLVAFSPAGKRIAEEVRRYDVKAVASGNVRFVINQITTMTQIVQEIADEDITLLMLTQLPDQLPVF